ncbi:enoyl-CoA hydratase-related protein [Bartonella sp. LJL80]
MTHDKVLTNIENGILTIVINRPEVRNAVDSDVHTGIGDALEVANQRSDIRVVVITGAGDKAFCAGADLKILSEGKSIAPDDPVKAAWGFAGFVRHPISKPVIAAVNGFALGGGTEITLASDLAVAAQTASFGLPEVKRGIMAAGGGSIRIAKQLPVKKAMEILLTGDPISAQDALAYGLVNKVVAAENLLDEAYALAQRIAANAPLSVQMSKAVALGIVDGSTPSEAAAWDHMSKAIRFLKQTSDAKEGTKAFAEKRLPHWTGA